MQHRMQIPAAKKRRLRAAARLSPGDTILMVAIYCTVGVVGLLCLLPLLHLFALSFSDNTAVAAGQVGIWPVNFTWNSMSLLFNGTTIVDNFINSVIITVVAVVLCMTGTILAAYPLSRPYFYGRRFFSFAILFTMFFGGGVIPTYLVVRALGLLDSYWALWIPGLISAWNMWVLRTSFANFPQELLDSARIDGCGDLRLLVQIILPLSLPVLATLSLYYAVGFWNSFFYVLLYLQTPSKYNLAVFVQQMVMIADLQKTMASLPEQVRQTIQPEGVRAAADLIMILPIIVVYPFIQKYFVKGSLIGSLKE